MHFYTETVHRLHELLCAKKVSATELTKDLLTRIEKTDENIGAYLTVTKDNALKKAQEVDEKIARGETLSPLAGTACAIKDNICTKGIRTTCSSKILENFIPPYDASVITKLYHEDAIILGKVNMDEFAMGGSTENSAYKLTRNPWNKDYVPGGSSGGSAAAVASGTAIWALGSDTGGSIRQPAAFCGLVGMKPTYGRVSRYGLVAYASSLDQIGPLTRDVTDCAIVMNAIAGHDPMDSTSTTNKTPDYTHALQKNIKGLKIGIPKEFFIAGIDEEVKKAIEEAINDCQKLGAEIRDISLPHTKYAISTYYLIAAAEAATNLERYDGVSYGVRVNGSDVVDMMKNTRTEKFGEEVQRRIMIGNYALSAGYYDAYYLKALKVRTLIQKDYKEALEKVDVIMTPTAPTPAFKINSLHRDPMQMYLQDIFTVTLNLAGLPGISLPCGYTKTGLPIGLQIIGKPLAEETLIRVAYTYEQNHDFCNKIAGGEAI